jgi:hypothetical protein
MSSEQWERKRDVAGGEWASVCGRALHDSVVRVIEEISAVTAPVTRGREVEWHRVGKRS